VETEGYKYTPQQHVRTSQKSEFSARVQRSENLTNSNDYGSFVRQLHLHRIRQDKATHAFCHPALYRGAPPDVLASIQRVKTTVRKSDSSFRSARRNQVLGSALTHETEAGSVVACNVEASDDGDSFRGDDDYGTLLPGAVICSAASGGDEAMCDHVHSSGDVGKPAGGASSELATWQATAQALATPPPPAGRLEAMESMLHVVLARLANLELSFEQTKKVCNFCCQAK